jgi:hypothetical protein
LSLSGVLKRLPLLKRVSARPRFDASDLQYRLLFERNPQPMMVYEQAT